MTNRKKAVRTANFLNQIGTVEMHMVQEAALLYEDSLGAPQLTVLHALVTTLLKQDRYGEPVKQQVHRRCKDTKWIQSLRCSMY